jgi:hypothetical protein
LSHLLFLPRYYVGFGRFTLYLKDEHMAHFFEIVFLHHYMDITRTATGGSLKSSCLSY